MADPITKVHYELVLRGGVVDERPTVEGVIALQTDYLKQRGLRTEIVEVTTTQVRRPWAAKLN
jgi:hypothetical protein